MSRTKIEDGAQFQLIPAHEVENETALKPYRSGDFGTVHVPVELCRTSYLTPNAIVVFLHFLTLEAMGEDLPSDPDTIARQTWLSDEQSADALAMLCRHSLVEFDEESIWLHEPDEWREDPA